MLQDKSIELQGEKVINLLQSQVQSTTVLSNQETTFVFEDESESAKTAIDYI